MILRPATPAERVIVRAIYDAWQRLEGPENFNTAISRAADRCGVTYARAEWLSRRSIAYGQEPLPSFGRGL